MKPLSLRLALTLYLATGTACIAGLPAARAQATVAEPAGAPAVAAAAQDPDQDLGELGQILATIAARSPEVLAAEAARAQAEAQARQARGAWFGTVDAYALSQHYNDQRLTRTITQPPDVANYPFASDQFGYGLDFQLPIDLSGKIAAEVDAAKSRAAGAGFGAADTRLRTLLQGATLYRNLQALTGQRAALERQLEALDASRRVAKTGLKAGNIARVNLLRVQAALADLQAQIAGVEGQRQSLRAELAALMGVAAFAGAVQVPAAGPVAPPADPDLMPPGIRAAQSALQASQATLRSARRAQYPQFAATGGWNRNAIQWDERAEDTWQVGLSMRVNLWSGGVQKSTIAAARAAEEEAQQRLQSAQNTLRAAREGAFARWQAQAQVWRAAESGLRAAAESARIEHSRFANGLGSATDLIDAEAALARARAGVTGALAGWWQADDVLRYAYGEPPAALRVASIPPSASMLP